MDDDIDYNPEDELMYDLNEEKDIYNKTDFLLRKNNSIMICQTNDLIKIREKVISEFCFSSSLNRDESIIALINYKWNIDKASQDWFDDIEKNMSLFGLEIDKNSINLTSRFMKNNKCLICEDNIDKNNSFSLKCSHFSCLDCWKEYISNKLDDLFCCLYSTCPQKDCNLIIPESIFEKFIGIDKGNISKFEKIKLRNFTENNLDIKWCPKDCGKCVKSEVHYNKEIECECRYVYCFSCLREGHRPCFCELLEAWEKKGNSEGLNVDWIKFNTKQCPSCRKHIEKNQGCNHMVCSREVGGCGHEFCWICLGDWKIHGTEYYKCNFFDPNKNKSEEEINKDSHDEFNKFSFYYDRYNVHLKSKEHIGKITDKIKKQEEALIGRYVCDTDFLWEGFFTIIKGLRTLMNTYIFGFYLKNDCSYKNLYEYNQYLLERNVDFLVERLENQEEFYKMMKIKDFDQFNSKVSKFRDDIKNYAGITEKYIKSVIDEIEGKMIYDLTKF